MKLSTYNEAQQFLQTIQQYFKDSLYLQHSLNYLQKCNLSSLRQMKKSLSFKNKSFRKIRKFLMPKEWGQGNSNSAKQNKFKNKIGENSQIKCIQIGFFIRKTKFNSIKQLKIVGLAVNFFVPNFYCPFFIPLLKKMKSIQY
ncbi:transmembrane protein, putative (macronuclear) [Tetrahymena thermophila SB210]|uniref:Transmembrane protein, putative n=1 Tax=Tetrahymena thermophila (strain SB210) TaxID=312017 RepID=W7X135_TETTS|nr:transmembrane protein, putative [Tetrahymena thermophila SB210]EWS72885.1 transmembrane protein, putative [Tetrahymena thermophila SB210]|eukprot:XP_012654582.1 transmembrane protein, putative [Tetrahymena thermophila SB210]